MPAATAAATTANIAINIGHSNLKSNMRRTTIREKEKYGSPSRQTKV